MKLRSSAVLFLGLALIAMVLIGCTSTPMQSFDSRSAGNVPESPFPPAPDRFSALEFPTDAEWLNTGEPLTMAELSGRYVLLDFWTYGCVNCYHMVPNLNAIQARYNGRVVVVGVHSAKFSHERESDNIREAVARYDIRYPVINDAQMALWSGYGVPGWPTIILIDPDGYVVGGHVGEWPLELLTPLLDAAVAGTAAPPTGGLDPVLVAAQPRIPATLLRFPEGLHADEAAGLLYVVDSGNNRVLAVDSTSGVVQSVYGSGIPGFEDGAAAAARFRRPRGVVRLESTLYVADTGNHALRAIDVSTGTVRTVAQGGLAVQDGLRSPWGLATDGTVVLIANAGEHQIWRYDPRNERLEVLAGSSYEGLVDGELMSAEFAQPSGLAWRDGILYVADPESSAVRAVVFAPDASVDAERPAGRVETLIGTGLFEFGYRDGPAATAQLMHAADIVPLADGLVIADSYNNRLRILREGVVYSAPIEGLREPTALTLGNGALWVADTNNHRIVRVDPQSFETRPFELRAAAGESARQTISARVAPLRDSITVRVEPPEGYKLNPDSPNQVVLRAAGEAEYSVRFNRDENELRVELAALVEAGLLRAQEGRQSFEVELWLYYCEEEDETVCRFNLGVYTLALETTGSPPGAMMTGPVRSGAAGGGAAGGGAAGGPSGVVPPIQRAAPAAQIVHRISAP